MQLRDGLCACVLWWMTKMAMVHTIGPIDVSISKSINTGSQYEKFQQTHSFFGSHVRADFFVLLQEWRTRARSWTQIGRGSRQGHSLSSTEPWKSRAVHQQKKGIERRLAATAKKPELTRSVPEVTDMDLIILINAKKVILVTTVQLKLKAYIAKKRYLIK